MCSHCTIAIGINPLHRYYIGACPKVAITDVELAKEIMVKEFDNFRDRGMIVGVFCENLLITISL